MKLPQSIASKLGIAATLLTFSTPLLAVSVDVTVETLDDNALGLASNCDDLATPVSCPSLRDAIAFSEQVLTDGADSFVITLPSGNLTLNQGPLMIQGREVTIQAPEDSSTTIDGNGERIMEVSLYTTGGADGQNYQNSKLSLTRLNLINGSAPAGEDGGAILTDKVLIIKEALLQNNQANSGNGGAIAVSGDNIDVTIEDSVIKNNSAVNGGFIVTDIGYQGRLTIERTGIVNNIASDLGGAIYSIDGEVTLKNVTVASNTWNLEIVNNGGIYLNGPIEAIQNNDNLFQFSTITDTVLAGEDKKINIINTIITDCIMHPSVLVDDQEGNLSLSGNHCGINEAGALNQIVASFEELGLGNLNEELGFYPLVSGSPAIDHANPVMLSGLDQLTGPSGPVRPWDGDGDGDEDEDIGAIEFGVPNRNINSDLNSGNESSGGCSLNQAKTIEMPYFTLLLSLSLAGFVFNFRKATLRKKDILS
ncbi:MAG: hypothetical protein KDK66_02970 [Deltaproteobacteria bacterium]|nr:hypothetical protein [Deltaproteobacteria bacterium]